MASRPNPRKSKSIPFAIHGYEDGTGAVGGKRSMPGMKPPPGSVDPMRGVVAQSMRRMRFKRDKYHA
jgi:hypothetical protein